MCRAVREVGVCQLQKSVRWDAGECHTGFTSACVMYPWGWTGMCQCVDTAGLHL